jgi:hypothetical protein
MKISPLRVGLFHAERQTDSHDEASRGFLHFFESTGQNVLCLEPPVRHTDKFIFGLS